MQIFVQIRKSGIKLQPSRNSTDSSAISSGCNSIPEISVPLPSLFQVVFCFVLFLILFSILGGSGRVYLSVQLFLEGCRWAYSIGNCSFTTETLPHYLSDKQGE